VLKRTKKRRTHHIKRLRQLPPSLVQHRLVFVHLNNLIVPSQTPQQRHLVLVTLDGLVVELVKRDLLDCNDGVVLVDGFEDSRGSSSTDETELLVGDSLDLEDENEVKKGGGRSVREEK